MPFYFFRCHVTVRHQRHWYYIIGRLYLEGTSSRRIIAALSYKGSLTIGVLFDFVTFGAGFFFLLVLRGFVTVGM